MQNKTKTLELTQCFTASKIVTFIYRCFPKFKGYWKILEVLVKAFPATSLTFQAQVNLEGRFFNVPIDVREPYQIDVFAKDKQELCIPAVILRLIKEGGFYLDVGANAGWYCRFVCQMVGPSGLVVALEPSARAFSNLVKLKYKNLIPLPFAATEIDGEVLRDGSSPFRQSSSSTFFRTALQDPDNNIDDGAVLGRSLDHLLSEFKRYPNVLKIDVEGAELLVLRGSLHSLPFIDYVIVEVNSDSQCAKFGYQLRDIYAFMKSLGFLHFYDVRNSDNSVCVIKDGDEIAGDILFSKNEVIW